MSFAHTLVAFVVALGVLIVFHELGHYVVARLAGVKVLRFSIGFGRELWSRRFGADRTEWAVAVLPLGGYVKMLDEREGPVDPREAHRAFNRQSVWKRIAIVVAGPIANFLLAIAIYWLLMLGGVTEPKAILGAPEPGTVASAAGVAAGDRVVAVDGEPVATWQSLRWALLEAALDRKRVRMEVVDASGHVQWRDLDPAAIGTERIEGDVMAALGLGLYRPPMPPVLGGVVAGGAAERAGLRAGERIVSIDGVPVASWDEFVAIIRGSPGTPLRVVVTDGGAEREVVVTPEAVGKEGERIGRIGAAPQVDREALRELMLEVRYGPFEALAAATVKTWDMSLFSLRMLWKMVVGDLSWRNLSGPVTIADYAGQAAQIGLAPYLAFIALISISLGVLNLLPIPLLDGGHLMYYFAEVVKGSPVSERAMEVGQRVGLTLLIFLMAFAFYNDINRLLTG